MEWICTECSFETDSDSEADWHAEDLGHDVYPKEDYYIEKYYTSKKPEVELKKIGEKPGVTVVPWIKIDVSEESWKTPFAAGKFTAGWTGAYPNLCSGKWIVVVDHRPFILPHDRQGEPMGTFGVYSTWYFDEESCEQFEDYEDGLEFPEWLAENSEWLLAAFDANSVEKTWVNAQDFYNAVSNNDWRHNSCGGCI